jgi:hypothetical protein
MLLIMQAERNVRHYSLACFENAVAVAEQLRRAGARQQRGDAVQPPRPLPSTALAPGSSSGGTGAGAGKDGQPTSTSSTAVAGAHLVNFVKSIAARNLMCWGCSVAPLSLESAALARTMAAYARSAYEVRACVRAPAPLTLASGLPHY